VREGKKKKERKECFTFISEILFFNNNDYYTNMSTPKNKSEDSEFSYKKEELTNLQVEHKTKRVLSEKKLKQFQEEHDKTGVVYLSCIPPSIKPHTLRSLLSCYGEIGRLYLRPEGKIVNYI
jgi:hypothetical protein